MNGMLGPSLEEIRRRHEKRTTIAKPQLAEIAREHSAAAGPGNRCVSTVYRSSVARVWDPSVFTVAGMSIYAHVHASRSWKTRQ